MSIQEIFDDPSIRWHQRFEVDGIYSPGYHNIDVLMSDAEIPLDLKGKTVIDIGTTNASPIFEPLLLHIFFYPFLIKSYKTSSFLPELN
ncbi:hypothetical protein L2E65_20140 [Planktothrix agardhii 1801]|jgi:hypothetical protein|uniref:hypothetical protein n=1 Tax=Planktothrix agardhii TaxID=1160 RepID=UPI001F4163AC|nr:hypothetical protein [Planktothrix agardhii]MCF3627080.1 hypothetical protein [Planktothrix agardhii 1801]